MIHILLFWKGKNKIQSVHVCLQVERAPELAPAVEGLDLGVSVAQAKERVRQKRAAKKAPTMDWTKRNELFSNL